MKPIINAIPGYKIFEYQLVLNPHEELRNRILQVKQQFHDKFQAPTALYGKANIFPVIVRECCDL